MSASASGNGLRPGLRNQVLDGQACFRAALEAMSRPGVARRLAPEVDGPPPLEHATTALCLTLLDADTRVWLDQRADTAPVREYLRFHCGCPLVDAPEQADFAVIAGPSSMMGLDRFGIGEDQYPDLSATLICQVEALEGGDAATLSGPGVRGTIEASPRGLPHDFADRWAGNHALFPQGVDLFLTAGDRVMGLPRGVEWRV